MPARKREGYEMPFYFFVGMSLLLIIIHTYFGEDDDFKIWAEEEVKERRLMRKLKAAAAEAE